MKQYKIKDDILFINFLRSKPNLSEATKKHYEAALTKFYYAIQQKLDTIISTCKNQQQKVTEKVTEKTTDHEGNSIIEKTVTEFDVNSPKSYINIYINTFISYCEETNVKKNSTTHYLVMILAVLSYYGVKLPTFEKLKREPSEWNLLSKEDLKFIIADSTLTHASLISELKDTGKRLSDALKETIGDFMNATSEYHNYIEVDDFIDNAPQDMMATWEFYPQKTKKHNIKCITFSSPETCNLILQNLRKIKNESLPRINKEKGLNLKLCKNDALFSSKKLNYKGHFSQHSISDMFYRKNKKLKKHHIALINEDIEKGKLSIEDKEEAINRIPKFHAHGCRKYFISMINKNCGNLRICALLEGHTPPIATDPSYVEHDIEDVKETYLLALPDLSLENIETKTYTLKVRQEMEDKIKKLEEKNKKLESEVSEIDSIKDRLKALEKSKPSWDEIKKYY